MRNNNTIKKYFVKPFKPFCHKKGKQEGISKSSLHNLQSLASRNWNGPSFKMCYRQDLTKMCHCVCVLYPSEHRLYDDSLHSEYHYYISAKKWSFARARRTWLDLLGQRDHPFKTSAKFHDFWPLPPSRWQIFTTIHRQIWQIFEPPPPKNCRRLKWMVP